MKFVLAVAFLAAIPVASATPVTYSTTGSTLCIGANVCGTATQIFGNVQITFDPVINNVADPGGTFTFASLGNLDVDCVGGGTACASTVLPANLTLYILITQTAPTAGNGSIPGGILAGSISGNGSSTMITWPGQNSVSIGLFEYSIANNPLAVVPPGTFNGLTSIQARIEEVPEPSTFLLLSAGLIGLGLRKRLAKRA